MPYFVGGVFSELVAHQDAAGLQIGRDFHPDHLLSCVMRPPCGGFRVLLDGYGTGVRFVWGWRRNLDAAHIDGPPWIDVPE
jgi:hypothetical protein